MPKIQLRNHVRDVLALLALFLSAALSFAQPSLPVRFQAKTVQSPEGADIFVRRGGTGPVVSLIHGYAENSDSWAPLSADLMKDPNPNQAGVYTIMLRVPPITRIAAHSHQDDRVATVISGMWHLGYGDKFDETKFKLLPPGSFCTEPPGRNHFAETGSDPTVVQITGFGPSPRNMLLRSRTLAGRTILNRSAHEE